MARLPWLNRTRFWAPRNVFRLLKKTNVLAYFKDIFLFQHENVYYVYLIQSPHRCNSNEYMYTQHKITPQKNEKTFLKNPICRLTWRYDLPSFLGPKDVWAIEVLL